MNLLIILTFFLPSLIQSKANDAPFQPPFDQETYPSYCFDVSLVSKTCPETLPYQKTRLQEEHLNIRELRSFDTHIESFNPLFPFCSHYLKLFLCMTYFPLCHEQVWIFCFKSYYIISFKE